MTVEKIRLYVEHPLGEGQTLRLSQPQAHYLFGVMRLAPGDGLRVFNGRDGEWRATMAEAGKRPGTLEAMRLCLAEHGAGALYVNYPYRVAVIALWTGILHVADPFWR